MARNKLHVLAFAAAVAAALGATTAPSEAAEPVAGGELIAVYAQPYASARMTGAAERHPVARPGPSLVDVAEGGRPLERPLQSVNDHARAAVRASDVEILRETPRSALELLGRRSLDHALLR